MATRAAAIGQPARRRRLALVRTATGVLILAAATAIAVFVMLRTYAPLTGPEGGSVAPREGIARTVDPVSGSRGKTVYFAQPRLHGSAAAGFAVWNTGRFAVRLERVLTGRPAHGITPAITITGAALLRGETVGATRVVTRPFTPVTIAPHRSVFVVVRSATACSAESLQQQNSSDQTWIDHVALRYRYLRVLHRTQSVELPFALTLQCGGKLPASTPVP